MSNRESKKSNVVREKRQAELDDTKMNIVDGMLSQDNSTYNKLDIALMLSEARTQTRSLTARTIAAWIENYAEYTSPEVAEEFRSFARCIRETYNVEENK